LIKLGKLKKKQLKNRTVKKNRLEFLKNRLVRFYKPETEKTKSNRTQIKKNQAKLGKNQAKLEKLSQTEKTSLNQFSF
jgi:hypothetical protein